MKTLFSFGFLLLFLATAQAQNEAYARRLIDTLTSKTLGGRGYYQNGANKAAELLKNEFVDAELLPVGQNYFQEFDIAINCITGKPSVKLNGKELRPGRDFLIGRNSPTINGHFEVKILNQKPAKLDSLAVLSQKKDYSGDFILTGNKDRILNKQNVFGAAGLIMIADDLWWHVSDGYEVMDIPVITVHKDAIPDSPETIEVTIENKFYESYATQNVAAMIEGTKFPNQYILITAHYDHLGRMGEEVFFPGAHDNASGTAMMMDLARHFSENPPTVSMVFIGFGAEETGLDGSTFYADNPLVPLKNTLFSMNLDIIGSGSTGITVVNGGVLPEYFAMLDKINQKNNYLAGVKARGEAANSDHYPLYKKGVPAFFIYTTGDEYQEYHSVTDRAQDLPLTAYNGLFRLVRDFILKIPSKK